MSTETTATCRRCTRPVAEGMYACAACTAQTDDNMAFIEANAAELEATITRQDRVSAGTGGRASAETPLPLNLTASDTATRLRNTLTTWTRLVAEQLGTSIEEAFPEPRGTEGPICSGGDGSWCTHSSCRALIPMARRITDREMAAWLRKRLRTIAHREWGPQAFDELSRASVDLARAVDSPPPMISLGKCDECGEELRAHQEAAWVRCKGCCETYDVARRKDQLVARASHISMTAARLARVLTAANFIGPDGRPVVCEVKHVYNWVQRKHLKKRGTDPHTGKPTYSLAVAWTMHEKAVKRLFDKAAKQATHLESQAA
jgi:hypothetical protein